MDPTQQQAAARDVAELRYLWGGRVALYCVVHAFAPPAKTAEGCKHPHEGIDALEDTSPS